VCVFCGGWMREICTRMDLSAADRETAIVPAWMI
jgi:hypothetical protein